jgi:hypothetical protein
MGKPFRAWVLCGVVAAAATPVFAGTAEVSFIDPDRYFDVGTTPSDEERNMKQLANHVKALAQRYLPADQTIKVEFLQIDLAGETRPNRSGIDVRIARGGADWPRFTLRYSLQGPDSAVLGQSEETLSDMNYQGHTTDMRSQDPLRHEKRMLEEWFRKRFASEHARSGGG